MKLVYYITLHYITLHYITFHYFSLHYFTLHYKTLHYTTLHYTTLHYTTLHYTTLHYTTLHYTTLHYSTLHHTTLHHTTPLQYITLYYTILYYTILYYTTLYYIILYYIVSKSTCSSAHMPYVKNNLNFAPSSHITLGQWKLGDICWCRRYVSINKEIEGRNRLLIECGRRVRRTPYKACTMYTVRRTSSQTSSQTSLPCSITWPTNLINTGQGLQSSRLITFSNKSINIYSSWYWEYTIYFIHSEAFVYFLCNEEIYVSSINMFHVYI